MEHRFYLTPDQKMEDTKVEDRGQGLHMTRTEWERLGKHLTRKKDMQDILDKEEAKKKYLQEGSYNMMKDWENSLENIRKRKEEARLRKMEELQESRVQRFFQLRAEQAEIRKEYVSKVRKRMFTESGWPRDINSAFVYSQVLFEREKQKDFKKFVKNHEAEVEAEYAKLVKKNVKDEEDEKAAKERELYESRKEYGIFLRKIIEENEEKARLEEETRIKKETLDNVKATKEMNFIKKTQQDHRDKQDMELRRDKANYLKSVEELKKHHEQEEKEVDAVLALYQEAKRDIECMKIEKLAEKQASIIARREYVASMVAGKFEEKLEAENKLHAANAAEKEALEDAKNKAKADYQEELRNDRHEEYRKCMARKKEQERKETEMNKWDMVSRYKIAEVRKAYEENKEREIWQGILNRRKEILDQADEDEKKRMEAKAMDDCLSKVSFKEDDDKFFDYADEVLELAKKTGRSTYPLEKVVLEYKKFNSLMPTGTKCENCEDYHTGKGASMSRELINLKKKKKCKCHNIN